MLENLDTIRMARAMTAHASLRAGIVAGNVANADTPGYRTRDLASFSETWRNMQGGSLRATRPGHLLGADSATGTRIVTQQGGRSPNGNSVSLEAEMVRFSDVKRQHELSLAVYRSSLNMLRLAAGRRG
ncbi:FlgB family protein [Paracoccus aerodenitrificans]|uniref:FlgB family protein n=1 Tax=Paracoccus aerodenitrificans TaxID=3017781 RepID=UPI0022F04718|nr:FlgB family protein [Paracoccus aerodenitrificans]WBU63280.1 FlgB family protein [Paracoccus aerodenitrificans]